jgi:hypothetical protein
MKISNTVNAKRMQYVCCHIKIEYSTTFSVGNIAQILNKLRKRFSFIKILK